MNISKLRYLLREGIEQEIIKLKKIGYSVIDKTIIGNYTMLLLYNEDDDLYEISLTSFDYDFTTFDSQIKKSSNNRTDLLQNLKKIKDKINEWLKIHSPLLIGTLNKSRALKYNAILSKLGFVVSKVKYNPPDDNFPDFWDFTIKN